MLDSRLKLLDVLVVSIGIILAICAIFLLGIRNHVPQVYMEDISKDGYVPSSFLYVYFPLHDGIDARAIVVSEAEIASGSVGKLTSAGRVIVSLDSYTLLPSAEADIHIDRMITKLRDLHNNEKINYYVQMVNISTNNGTSAIVRIEHVVDNALLNIWEYSVEPDASVSARWRGGYRLRK